MRRDEAGHCYQDQNALQELGLIACPSPSLRAVLTYGCSHGESKLPLLSLRGEQRKGHLTPLLQTELWASVHTRQSD